MFIRVGFEITLDCVAETPLLLALSLHPDYPGRVLGSARVRAEPAGRLVVPLEDFLDEFGNRRTRLVAPPGSTTLWSDCILDDAGLPDAVDPTARQHPIAELPPATLGYLSASRYCEVDALGEQAWALFGSTPPGWPRVQAICDWVHAHVTFGYDFARSTKTAVDTLREGRGVCRDFAQLAVALCRAMNVPARYAGGYLGDIGVPPAGPGDFCAWLEVFLGGRWYSLDARYNTPRIGRILMVRGRDAADTAMITAFGAYDLTHFRVWTEELPGGSDEKVAELLRRRPDAPALTLAPPRHGRKPAERRIETALPV